MTNEQKYKIVDRMVVPVVMMEPKLESYYVAWSLNRGGEYYDFESFDSDLEAYRTYISSLPSPVQASKELIEQMGDREFTGEEYETELVHTCKLTGECKCFDTSLDTKCDNPTEVAYPITKQGEEGLEVWEDDIGKMIRAAIADSDLDSYHYENVVDQVIKDIQDNIRANYTLTKQTK